MLCYVMMMFVQFFFFVYDSSYLAWCYGVVGVLDTCYYYTSLYVRRLRHPAVSSYVFLTSRRLYFNLISFYIYGTIPYNSQFYISISTIHYSYPFSSFITVCLYIIHPFTIYPFPFHFHIYITIYIFLNSRFLLSFSFYFTKSEQYQFFFNFTLL